MTEQKSNYERAGQWLDEALDLDPDNDIDVLAASLGQSEVRALLAVADELRALRELLAERLTVTENVTIHAGDPGVTTAAILAALREADGR